MTPKEKAEELIDKFTQTNGNAFFAKECALIAVNEILSAYLLDLDEIEYWIAVKQEIENL